MAPSNPNHIDHALVAEFHPPEYLMHKYWARKPSNVVRKYIETYSERDDIVLDPFCGSGVAAIEAVRSGRRAIGIDLNPMATFISRMTAKPVNLDAYESAFLEIEAAVRDAVLELYETDCPKCGASRVINKTIWRDGEIEALEYECSDCAEGRSRLLEKQPDSEDLSRLKHINSRDIPKWYPKNEFRYPTGEEFAEGTHDAERSSVADLFTHRNLIALSLLFDAIDGLPEGDVKELMKFTFTGQLHLGSRMLPARTSRGGPVWSQHRYWLPPDFWELNVWSNFETRYQRVRRGKERVNDELGHYEEAEDFPGLRSGDGNILWATADALEELRTYEDSSVDYVFTDPPYGESIQYGELTYMWAAWLGLADEHYLHSMEADEAVINPKQGKDAEEYYNLLYTIFHEVGRVASPQSYMTVTFHNPSFEIRNILERACYVGGYDLERILWQPPAQVPSSKSHLDPYGSVQGDFYFRFRNAKQPGREISEDEATFNRVVVEAATDTLAHRGEPTPMNIVTNGIEPALAEHGFPFASESSISEAILEADEFIVLGPDGSEMDKARTSKLEDKTLWFAHPDQYLLDQVPLNERVETTVHGYLKRRRKVEFTDVMRELYIQFQNSLTPEPGSVKGILEEYAEKEGAGVWKVKTSTRNSATRHSRIIGKLAEAGRICGYRIWIGTPEQSDMYEESPLRALVDYDSLELPNVPPSRMPKIRNIDVLWLDEEDRIVSSFEVENTTSITSGIVRGSNIPYEADKYIVVPKERESLLVSRLDNEIIAERLRREDSRWRFVFSEDFERRYTETDGVVGVGELQELATVPDVSEEAQAFLNDY